MVSNRIEIIFKGDYYYELFKRIRDNFVNVEPEIGKAITTILKMNPRKEFESFYHSNIP
jgi:hypothetical protein